MNYKKIDLEPQPYMSITTMSGQVEQLIINATSFQPEKDLKYSKPKINKSGGKSVNVVSVKTNTALTLSTPLMLTWGVNEYVDDASGKKTYNMALQFPSEEYKSYDTGKFLDAMVVLQDKIKADAVNNCKDWFGKAKMSGEVVDALFHPMLQYPKDPNTGEPNMERSPTLKIKLDYWDNKFNCEIYDMNSQPIFPRDDVIATPMELIPKATNVATVIRCGGLWFANGKFGVTWRLEQAVVKPKASFKGRCMIQLSQTDTEKLNAQVVDDDNVEDSDEEVETAAEPEPVVETAAAEPEPVVEPLETETETEKPKVIKKKKVVRKKT